MRATRRLFSFAAIACVLTAAGMPAFAQETAAASSTPTVLVTGNDRDFHRIRRYVPFDYVKPWPGGVLA